MSKEMSKFQIKEQMIKITNLAEFQNVTELKHGKAG